MFNIKSWIKYNESKLPIDFIMEDVYDILSELSDLGFKVEDKQVKVEYTYGNSISYGRKSEDLEIYLWKNEEYDISDIIEVYNRLCFYLESNGFRKELLAKNGYTGSIPHLRVSNFMNRWSSRFTFRRWSN